MSDMAEFFIEEDEHRAALEWEYAMLKLTMGVDENTASDEIKSQFADLEWRLGINKIEKNQKESTS